jgi:hypothetical protein
MTQFTPLLADRTLPIVASAGKRGCYRFLEFLTVQISFMVMDKISAPIIPLGARPGLRGYGLRGLR